MAQWPGWRGCSPITESVSTPKGPMETDNRMGEYSRASCEKESRKEAPGAHPPPFCHPSFLQKTKGTCQPLAPQNISFQSRGGHGRGAASFINAALFWGRLEWMHAQEWLAEPSARAGRPYRGAECRSPFHMEMDDAECSQLLYNWLWLTVVEKGPTGTRRRLGIGREWKGGKHRVGKPIKPFRSAPLTPVRNFTMH